MNEIAYSTRIKTSYFKSKKTVCNLSLLFEKRGKFYDFPTPHLFLTVCIVIVSVDNTVLMCEPKRLQGNSNNNKNSSKEIREWLRKSLISERKLDGLNLTR